MYNRFKFQTASMEMICCNSYLVTSSKKDTKVDSTPVFMFVCLPPDNTQTFLWLKIPNLLKISAFALALAFILTLLMSVCHRLLALDRISTGVESALFALLCIVRKNRGQKAQMVCRYSFIMCSTIKKKSETEKVTHWIDDFWESMSLKTWKPF